MITQRAVIIGFVGACFYIVALVNQLPSYYSILTWLSITMLVSCAGVAALSLQGVTCLWRVLRARASASLDAVALSSSGGAYRVLDTQLEATEIGSGPVLEIELHNNGTLNKTAVLIDVRVHHMARDIEMTRRFMIESLPARNSVASTLTLRGLPRGRYEIVGITLIGSDVLGLFHARHRIFGDPKKRRSSKARPLSDPRATLRFYLALCTMGVIAFVIGILARSFTWFGGSAALVGGVLSILVGASGLMAWWRSIQAMQAPRERQRVAWSDGAPDQLLVGPATIGAGRLEDAASSAESGSESVQYDALGRGDELRGTRPYVAGDDLRTVHWKSTARLGRLVVKEFHRPSRTQCTVIWDGAAGTATRPPTSTRTVIQIAQNADSETRNVEMALSLAASLCRAWLERGLDCTFLQSDSSGARTISQPGGRGLSAAYVEALADADAARETPFAPVLTTRLRDLPRDGDVFLITTQPLEPSENGPILNADLRRSVAVLKQRGGRVTVAVVVAPNAASRNARAANSSKTTAHLLDTPTNGTASNRVLDLRQNSPADAQNTVTIFADGSGARVVVVSPPLEKRRARVGRFTPPVQVEERRTLTNSRLVQEQGALRAALDALMSLENSKALSRVTRIPALRNPENAAANDGAQTSGATKIASMSPAK